MLTFPGRYRLQVPGLIPVSFIEVGDLDNLVSRLEEIVGRPIDRFNEKTGEVTVDHVVILTAQYAGRPHPKHARRRKGAS